MASGVLCIIVSVSYIWRFMSVAAYANELKLFHGCCVFLCDPGGCYFTCSRVFVRCLFVLGVYA